MPGLSQPVVDRLREFLRGLKPGPRALLIAEIERAMARGEGFDGADFIITELRRSLREKGPNPGRIGDQARLFFQPLEPFLVDDAPDHAHRGRVARSALEPIWLWLSNTVMPDEARDFTEEVEHALLAGDTDGADHLALVFQEHAVERIDAALRSVAGDDKARRKLAVSIGTPRSLDDVHAVLAVLKARDSLSLIGAQLPGHIKNLSGGTLDNVKSLLDAPLASNVFLYALVLVMSRMAAPWQLIRLAVKAAGGDNIARIADTPYALAITIVLAELERMVAEFGEDLKNGRGLALTALLKDVHDAARGLRTELDLSSHPDWQRQLATVRSDISKIISAQLELLPGRVRRLLRPRPAKDIVPGATVDAHELEDVEAMLGFMVACRDYASELAVNEVTQRTLGELQQALDSGTRTLLDALRTATDAERPFRQSQVDAAVRFCGKVFGQEYASLLTKAAEVASHTERKAARA